MKKWIAIFLSVLMLMINCTLLSACPDGDEAGKNNVIAKKEIRTEEDRVVVVYEDGMELPYEFAKPYSLQVLSFEGVDQCLISGIGTSKLLGSFSSSLPNPNINPGDAEKVTMGEVQTAAPQADSKEDGEKQQKTEAAAHAEASTDKSVHYVTFETSPNGNVQYAPYEGNGEYVFNAQGMDGYNAVIITPQYSGSSIEIDGKKYQDCENEVYQIFVEKITSINLHIEEVEDLPEAWYLQTNCFSGYKNVEKILLPAQITKIRSRAFDRCTALSKVFYEGTEEQWQKIDLDQEGNDALLNSTVYFYSEEAPTEEGNFWHLVDGEPLAWE